MRVFKRIILSIIIFIGILITIITIFINTRYTKEIVLKVARKFIVGDFNIGSLRITPLGVRVKNVLWEKDGEKILSLDIGNVSFNPFKLKELKIKKVYVNGIYVNKIDSIKSFLRLKGGGGKILPVSIEDIKIENGKIVLKNYNINLSTDISIISKNGKMNIDIKGISMNLNDSLPVDIIGKTSIGLEKLEIGIEKMNIRFKNGFINIDGNFGKESEIVIKGNIDVKDFSSILPVNVGSKVLIDLNFKGNAKSPFISGNLFLKDISFQKYYLNYLNITPELKDKDFKVIVRTDGFYLDAKGNYLKEIKGKLVMKNFNIKEYTGKNSDLNGVINFNLDRKGNGLFSVLFNDSKFEEITMRNINIKGKRYFNDITIDTIHIDGEGINLEGKGIYKNKEFDLFIRSEGINLAKLQGIMKLKAEGFVKMEFKIKGDIKNPSLSGFLVLNSFSMNKINIDSLFIKPEIENIKNGDLKIFVNDVKFGKNDIQNIILNANIEEEKINYSLRTDFMMNHFVLYGDGMIKDTIFLNIDTLKIKMEGKEDIKNRDVIKIEIVKKDINIKDFSIIAPGLQMIITGFAGDKLDLTINISSPDLRKIAIFAGLKQILKGDLDFYISVRGTKENPVFGVYGLVHNFQFNDVKFDSLFILADYKDEFITLHSLKMQKDTISSVITAKVPFGLKKGIIKDREIYANANINFSDIRFLSSYIKEVNLYKGEFKMNVEAKGDMNNLNIDGNIGLSNISFSIPKINLKMEGFSGNIKLNEKKVELEIVNGEKTIKTKGYVLLKDLKPYDMNINTELVNFYIKDVFYTEANLKGLLSLQGSPFSPSLKGNIDIMKVVANIPFGGRKKGVKPREFPMDIDITINMPRNVWIRNDLVDMELGGMVKVKKKDRIKIEGEMNVLAGYFYYFDKPFNVEEGKFLFVEEIIPNINLKARSTLSYEEETEDKKKNIITGPVVLEVSGTLQDLQFDLYTEPPLPPLGLQEIIPLLNLDMKWSDLAKFQRMSTTIPSKAVSYVIRTQLLNRIRNSLGIDALDLNANLFGAEKTTQITVGKYFTKNIYGSYTRDIFATNPDQFLLKYIMRRGNIILQRNEEGNIWGGFEVNIKR